MEALRCRSRLWMAEQRFQAFESHEVVGMVMRLPNKRAAVTTMKQDFKLEI